MAHRKEVYLLPSRYEAGNPFTGFLLHSYTHKHKI